MGEMTPVFAMVHFRFREASQRTMRDEGEEEWPGSEAVALPLDWRGGKSLATHRSPCGEGVKR
jgi:hypothetical protein